MISYAEQELLETIVKNTSRSLQDIYTVLGKVYDDELALDLNIQAAGYSGIKEKAANCLFETGNVPPLLGVMERAKRWGMLQAKTALNVNTGYMANMLAKEERLRRSDMQKATQKLEICGKESETIAREFLNLEEKNIRILQNYCRKKEKKSAKNGFTNATDAADWLVKQGVPFRDAHAIIGKLVLYCIEHNTNLDDLSLAEYKAISPVFDESVYAAINVNECAQARKVIGGPAKEVTTAAIAANKEYFKTI